MVAHVGMLLLSCLAPAVQTHMPTFVDYKSCTFEDEASTQSMAIYTKVPPGAVAVCSFVINDINEELQLSLNMPISHYTASTADMLGVSIYAHGNNEWVPQCRAGWDGWHGSNENGVLADGTVRRVPLSLAQSNRIAVFEPWGVGGYVPIVGCSTPISMTGARHFISINNTNDREVRVCVGVGTKEEHFRSFSTWIRLKWSVSLWRTWEWGLSQGAFITILSCSILANVYIFVLFLYGAKPQWFCWIPIFSIHKRDNIQNGPMVSKSKPLGPKSNPSLASDTNLNSDSDPDSDSSPTSSCSSSSDSDCEHYEVHASDAEDRMKSDQVVDAAGFIVLFWISGVAIVWLVIFFLNRADVEGGQATGPKLIQWSSVWSPVMYVYTLPVVVFTSLYILARYSRLWKWFWKRSQRWNANIVSLLLISDIGIAFLFDMIYPFSFLSVAVCLYCLFTYMGFVKTGRRFHPTVSGKYKRKVGIGNGTNVKRQRDIDIKPHKKQSKRKQKTLIIVKASQKGGGTSASNKSGASVSSLRSSWVL